MFRSIGLFHARLLRAIPGFASAAAGLGGLHRRKAPLWLYVHNIADLLLREDHGYRGHEDDAYAYR